MNNQMKKIIENLEKIITEYNYIPNQKFFTGTYPFSISHIGDNSDINHLFLISGDNKMKYGYYTISLYELFSDSNFINAFSLYFISEVKPEKLKIIANEILQNSNILLENKLNIWLLKNTFSNFFSKKHEIKIYINLLDIQY